MSGSLAFSVAIVASGWIAQTIGFRGSYRLASAVYAVACCIALTITERRPSRLPVSEGGPNSHGPAPPRPSRERGRPGDEARSRAPIGFGELLRGPLRPLLVLAGSFGLPFAAVYAVWPVWLANTLGHGRAVYS